MAVSLELILKGQSGERNGKFPTRVQDYAFYGSRLQGQA
jgi:hypothetical protein